VFLVGDPDIELAETFAEIARALLHERDSQATLQRIVSLAVNTIDDCEHAGISMIQGRVISSPASSDEVPATVDRIQSETGEGPCLDAIKEHGVFGTDCLSTESRWPHFARRAHAESGIESILAFRLYADKDTMGALNLYSSKPAAFNDHDAAIATVFATHAAVALSTSRTIENLRTGMESRQLIGEATGMLMARQNISHAEAFDMLRRSSQRLNIKLRTIAQGIMEVPHDPTPT
jgi:transcriptional regulator with GAF, ATPase, and Fis domain